VHVVGSGPVVSVYIYTVQHSTAVPHAAALGLVVSMIFCCRKSEDPEAKAQMQEDNARRNRQFRKLRWLTLCFMYRCVMLDMCEAVSCVI